MIPFIFCQILKKKWGYRIHRLFIDFQAYKSVMREKYCIFSMNLLYLQN